MKPESNRAKRRHARWRAVQAALRLMQRWDSWKSGDELDSRGLHVQRRANDPERYADNMKKCSCLGCCSRLRKTNGPTMQELRRIDPPFYSEAM